MFDEDMKKTYCAVSRRLRNLASDMVSKGDFPHLKMSQSKGDLPERYRFQIMARRRRVYGAYETGKEAGGLSIGRNELNVNVRGPIILENKITLSSWDQGDDWGFNRPVLVRAGDNLKVLGKTRQLEFVLNQIGDFYRSNFFDNEQLFVRDVLEECNSYVGKIKSLRN